jgi:membrane protease YdiL (CAAX protease family)
MSIESPPVEPASPQRLLAFALITLAISLFMGVHFISIPKTIQAQGGNKLNEAGMTVVSKVVLASLWRPVHAYVAGALSSDPSRFLEAYPERLAELDKEIAEARQASTAEKRATAVDLDKQAKKLREQYAVMLVVLGAPSRAHEVLAPLSADPSARAIRDAFGMEGPPPARIESLPRPTSSKGPQAKASVAPTAPPSPTPTSEPAAAPESSLEPLGEPEFKAESDALEELSGSWQYLYVMEALTRRQKLNDRANELDDQLQAQASAMAMQILGIGVAFALNFVMGLVVVLVWLLKAREWNLQSLPTPIDAPPPDLSFDPLRGWGMLLAFQVVSLLVGAVVQIVLHRTGSVSSAGSVLLVIGVQLVIYALMIGLIGLAIRGRWASIGLHTRSLGRSFLAGLCLFWGAFIVVFGVGYILSLFFHGNNAQNNPVFHIIDEAGGGYRAIALLSLVAVLGPLFEEILFRGVIYTSMRRVMPARLAIPLNGLLFSAVHGDLNTLLPLAVLGMLLCYGYERTRSLATSFTCHCLWNAQTFLVFVTLFS